MAQVCRKYLGFRIVVKKSEPLNKKFQLKLSLNWFGLYYDKVLLTQDVYWGLSQKKLGYLYIFLVGHYEDYNLFFQRPPIKEFF